MPELLGAERLLADRGDLAGKFRARQADEVAPSIGKLHRWRIEQCRFGENPCSLRRGQFQIGCGHQRAGQALLIAA